MWPAAQEAVKKSLNEQKHSTQRRKVAEGAKRTEQLFFASLCALASLREIVYSFTASQAVGEGALPSRYKTSGQAPPSPLPPARERGAEGGARNEQRAGAAISAGLNRLRKNS
jgi:hypothetical protein